tara:strand:- start:51922 stop:52422 length:501 start_codon:yes stop_codon:yes gene_type:complete
MFEKEYRPNVAVIIMNSEGKLLWCRRKDHQGWQFPQGGIDKHESPLQAAIRETREEVGLAIDDLNYIYESKEWVKYKVPESRRKKYFINRSFVGQKQKWFLAYLNAKESSINLNNSKVIEFDKWQWVSYWYPTREIIDFKKPIYRKMLLEIWPVYKSFLIRSKGKV